MPELLTQLKPKPVRHQLEKQSTLAQSKLSNDTA